MEYTPAPWTIYDDGDEGSDIIMAFIPEYDENVDICAMSKDLPYDVRLANTRLIKAAPNLLEALQELLAEQDAGYYLRSSPARQKGLEAVEKATQ